ncbi:uncharacterized Nudix hydrolase NudL-like isoform X1 [Diadema antillarum]|uniref:uncharacterized Nudix hydrolase NudL-like isoform X1 n=2 Tax=Diadema antillarum TaxID=105358 RepID=UPI003A8C2C9B
MSSKVDGLCMETLTKGIPLADTPSEVTSQMAEHEDKLITLSKSAIRCRLQEVDVTERMKEEDVVTFASPRKKASVLVPLICCEDGDLLVLLTVRAKSLRTDAGDVAFPGGKQDDEDEDEIATALREAWEEIGLHQADVEVVSQLPAMISRAGYFVRVITGFIPEDFTPNVNPNEVDDVFRVPLIDFLTKDCHDSYKTKSKGRFARLHSFFHSIDDKEYFTYGLTAYICILAACAVYQRAPDFEMEPGFDHTRPLEGLLDLIYPNRSEEEASSSSSKL